MTKPKKKKAARKQPKQKVRCIFCGEFNCPVPEHEEGRRIIAKWHQHFAWLIDWEFCASFYDEDIWKPEPLGDC